MRILGQILLWLGFLTAAIASVSKKEYDFLPEVERNAFSKLKSKAWFTQWELEQWSDNSIEDMESEEFSSLLLRHCDNANERFTSLKEYSELGKKKLSELSSEELKKFETYKELFVASSMAREKEAQNKKDGIKPPAKSDEQKKLERKQKRKINKEQLVKMRTTSLPNRWFSVRWFWYCGAMVIGISGVVILRMQSRSEATDTVSIEAEYSRISESIKVLTANIAHLKDNISDMKPGECVEFIDNQCAPAFADFADARESLKRKFGLQAFADIMTQFSSSERMINRTWSSAADGYMEEAQNCVDIARVHIDNTADLLKKQQ